LIIRIEFNWLDNPHANRKWKRYIEKDTRPTHWINLILRKSNDLKAMNKKMNEQPVKNGKSDMSWKPMCLKNKSTLEDNVKSNKQIYPLALLKLLSLYKIKKDIPRRKIETWLINVQ